MSKVKITVLKKCFYEELAACFPDAHDYPNWSSLIL